LRRMRFLASHTGGDLDLYTRDLVAGWSTLYALAYGFKTK